MITYKEGKFSDVEGFKNIVKKERVTLENPEGATWFIAVDEEAGKVVGFSCIVISKMKNARFKSDYVLKEYRGRGIYEELFKLRLSFAVKNRVKKATAFCTPLSVGCYYKYGFNCASKKGDISFVEKNILK